MRSDSGHGEEKITGKSYDLKLFGRLFPFIKPYRVIFYLSILLMIVISGLDISIPYMTKIAVDNYIVPVNEIARSDASAIIRLRADITDVKEVAEAHRTVFVNKGDYYEIQPAAFKQLSQDEKSKLRSGDMAGLTFIASCMIGIVLLNFLLNFAQKLVMEIAGQRIMHDLRMYLFGHIQSLPLSFFNTNPVGRLVTRVTNDVQNLHELFTSVIIFLFKDVFLITGIAIVLCVLSLKLALVSFIVLPFVIYASFYFAGHAREVFRELRLKVSQINTRFSETIQGIKVIQLFRNEKRNDAKFRELNHENYLAGMRQIHIFAVFLPVIDMLASTALAVIIFYGGSGVISETITLGTLVAFISYMKMFFRPIRDIADKFNIIQNSMASAERIFLILDEKGNMNPDKLDSTVGTSQVSSIDRIEFDAVGFSYTPGIPVLKDISFNIRKKETLAVVGPTGAGKTSLIHLMIRLYNADSGRIRVNGTDIKDISKLSLRSRIALVNQDPFLFSGTIRDTIMSGKTVDSGYTVEQILDIANCRSFVEKLPEGLDTVLTAGAETLSSGERQLLSIARAIAGNPDLIILDEATSYIDTESEVKIQEALDNLMVSRTSVIIAHRLSTAKHADTILVLNKGKIVESGKHDELMAKKGLYWKLTTVQSEQ